jgi:hypothetical protein
MEAEADKHRPRETGGVLLGITGPGKKTWEVTELIPAGPAAKRERHRFAPDGPWQRAEIAKRHERSMAPFFTLEIGIPIQPVTDQVPSTTARPVTSPQPHALTVPTLFS